MALPWVSQQQSESSYRERARQLKVAVALVFIVVALSSVGYVFIEGWSFLDGLYMTIITVGTVGFREVQPLSGAGKVFTMAVILCGVGTSGYAVGLAAQMVIGGEMRRLMGRNMLDEKIRKLKDHFIVCGFGRMGELLCEELSRGGSRFVVVDTDPERVAAADERGLLSVHGNASDGETLSVAGIERASSLVSVLNSDAENLFVTLTARQLNPKLKIIARAETARTVSKLQAAGADRVVSPHAIGASRIAQLLTRPSLVDFVEIATKHGPVDFQMQEIPIEEGSPYAGKTIRDGEFRKRLGANVVAIKRAGGESLFNPPPETTLLAGDILIALAPPQGK